MFERRRRGIGGALLLTLFASLAAGPASAATQREDESLRSGERVQSRTADPPLSLQNVAATLRTMGRGDMADRLISDYNAGRVRLGDPGSRATTDPPLIVPLVTNRRDNVMTLDKQQFTTQCDTKQTDRNPVTDGTVGWALTIVHEYVHMEQDNPTQTPRFENAGWRDAVHENQRWMRRVMSQVSDAEKMPNRAEKIARLRELSRHLELLRVVHQTTINDLGAEIAAGHVGADQEWPTIEAGSSTDLGAVVKSANELVAANIKNTRDDIARIEREIAAGASTDTRAPTAPAGSGAPAPGKPAIGASDAKDAAPAAEAPTGPRIQDTKYFLVRGSWDYTSTSGTYGINLLSDRQGQLTWEGNKFSFSFTTLPEAKAQTKVTKVVSFKGQLSPDGTRMETFDLTVKTTYADRGRVYMTQDEALSMKDVPRTWTPDSRIPFGDKKDEYRYTIERPDDAKARLVNFMFRQEQSGQTIQHMSLFTFRKSSGDPPIKIVFGRQPVY